MGSLLNWLPGGGGDLISGLGAAAGAVPGMIGGVTGMPGPGNIPGIPGIGGLQSAPLFPGGPQIPGLGSIETGVSNFFDNPGGHTDSNYNMFIPEAGSPAATPQNLGTGGYRGDQSGIIAGLDSQQRPIGPAIQAGANALPPPPPAPLKVYEPHGTQLGQYGGAAMGTPAGWGQQGAGAWGAQNWERSGGTKGANWQSSPGDGPTGSGWSQVGADQWKKKY